MLQKINPFGRITHASALYLYIYICVTATAELHSSSPFSKLHNIFNNVTCEDAVMNCIRSEKATQRHCTKIYESLYSMLDTEIDSRDQDEKHGPV